MPLRPPPSGVIGPYRTTRMLPVELGPIVQSWTETQLAQARAADFTDASLQFKVTHGLGLSDSLRHYTETPDGSPTVHHVNEDDVRFEGLSLIGGLDISFPLPDDSGREQESDDESGSKGNWGIAVLAVLSFPDMKLLYYASREVDVSTTPYVPSYLSFREAGPYAALLHNLERDERHSCFMPQVLLVDGNGRFHVRQAGSAVAVGLATGVPTIGVAKEYHPLPCHASSGSGPPQVGSWRSTQKSFRTAAREALLTRGDLVVLPDEAGRPIGAAVLSSPHKSSRNPVYVSSGHRVSLETSVAVTLACCTSARVPEPIRRADEIGRRLVKERYQRAD